MAGSTPFVLAVVAEKRLSDVFHYGRRHGIGSNADRVEAELFPDARMPGDPNGRRLTYGLERLLRAAASGLHLDESDDVPFACDDVDLGSTGPPVPSEDLDAVRRQVGHSDLFAGTGNPLGVRRPTGPP